MKAYVIKNKEGKYLTEMFDWSDDLYFAMTYDETHQLSHTDEYWQEITIAEGDLEKQIRADERRKVCKEIREKLQLDIEDKHGFIQANCIAFVLDKIEEENGYD